MGVIFACLGPGIISLRSLNEVAKTLGKLFGLFATGTFVVATTYFRTRKQLSSIKRFESRDKRVRASFTDVRNATTLEQTRAAAAVAADADVARANEAAKTAEAVDTKLETAVQPPQPAQPWGAKRRWGMCRRARLRNTTIPIDRIPPGAARPHGNRTTNPTTLQSVSNHRPQRYST